MNITFPTKNKHNVAVVFITTNNERLITRIIVKLKLDTQQDIVATVSVVSSCTACSQVVVLISLELNFYNVVLHGES